MNRKRSAGERDQSGAVVKKANLNLYHGDRYCTMCSGVIRGQAKDLIRRCPIKSCGAFQPNSNEMWEYSNGWGRCKGNLCYVVLSDEMLYCYFCGMSNDVAFKKRERKLRIEMAEKLSQECKDKERIRVLEEAVKEKDRIQEELRQTISKQEEELFNAKGISFEDDDMAEQESLEKNEEELIA